MKDLRSVICVDDRALAQVTQRGCRISSLEIFKSCVKQFCPKWLDKLTSRDPLPSPPILWFFVSRAVFPAQFSKSKSLTVLFWSSLKREILIMQTFSIYIDSLYVLWNRFKMFLLIFAPLLTSNTALLYSQLLMCKTSVFIFDPCPS